MRTLWSIHTTALRLADERGLDGFTMDELADEVGVARRTLFNHMPGKMDAVLGPDEAPPAELFETFVGGGPTGHLATDLRTLVLLVLEHKQVGPDDLVRFRRLARSEPRVLHAIHDRFELLVEEVGPILQQREGDQLRGERAALAIRLLLTVFDAAMDAFIEDTSRPIGDHYRRIFDTLTNLFR